MHHIDDDMERTTLQQNPKLLAVVVEADSLTRWSLESYLEPVYRVWACATFDEAASHLNDPSLRVVILGNVRNLDRAIIDQLAAKSTLQIVALVPDISQSIHQDVFMVEKPFALEQLAGILGMPGPAVGK